MDRYPLSLLVRPVSWWKLLIFLGLIFLLVVGPWPLRVLWAYLTVGCVLSYLTDGGYVQLSKTELSIRGFLRSSIDVGGISTVEYRSPEKPFIQSSSLVIRLQKSKWIVSTMGLAVVYPRKAIRLFLSPSDARLLANEITERLDERAHQT